MIKILKPMIRTSRIKFNLYFEALEGDPEYRGVEPTP